MVGAGFRDNIVFYALTLVSVIVVVSVVGYDVYRLPAAPRIVGTATVEVSGTGHFQGEVGTASNEYTVEGRAPFTIEVSYSRADYVSAYVRMDDQASGTAKIQVECRTLGEGTGH